MTEETRYGYEKRIRELKRENEILRDYRTLAFNIFAAVCGQIQEGKGISCGWIVKQFKDVMK